MEIDYNFTEQRKTAVQYTPKTYSFYGKDTAKNEETLKIPTFSEYKRHSNSGTTDFSRLTQEDAVTHNDAKLDKN